MGLGIEIIWLEMECSGGRSWEATMEADVDM